MAKITVELDNYGFTQRIKKDKQEKGWLDDQVKPPLLGVLSSMVNGYTEGQPVTADLEVITVSPQLWSLMNHDEREQLLELVEFTGGSAEEYMRHFKSMMPKDPKGKA